MYVSIKQYEDIVSRNRQDLKDFVYERVLDFKIDFGFSAPYKRMTVIEALFREPYLFFKKYDYLKKSRPGDHRFKYMKLMVELMEVATVKWGGQPRYYFGIYKSREEGCIIPTPLQISEHKLAVEHEKSFAVKHNFLQVWRALSNKHEIEEYKKIFRDTYNLPQRYSADKFKQWIIDEFDGYSVMETIYEDFYEEYAKFLKKNNLPSINKQKQANQFEFDFGQDADT